MPERSFTPAEANSALAEVRPVAERLVALRARMRELEHAQGDARHAIGGNGGGYAAGDLNDAQAELERPRRGCGRVRRPARGARRRASRTSISASLDFPAGRDGEDVLLCWHVGEDAVEFWHGLAEGYAGRKPIDWGE